MIIRRYTIARLRPSSYVARPMRAVHTLCGSLRTLTFGQSNMPNRTSPKDAERVEMADDVEDVVADKRAGWRASPAKARRRQRRYKRRILDELVLMSRQTDPDENR